MTRTSTKAPRHSMATTTCFSMFRVLPRLQRKFLCWEIPLWDSEKPWASPGARGRQLAQQCPSLFIYFPIALQDASPWNTDRGSCQNLMPCVQISHCPQTFSLLEAFLWRALWSCSVAPPTFWCHLKLLAQSQPMVTSSQWARLEGEPRLPANTTFPLEKQTTHLSHSCRPDAGGGLGTALSPR